MIDTDKYEGHNMHLTLLDVGDDYNNWDALQDMGFNDEARELMVDAPLLLEAYKELLAEIQHCRMIATQCLVAIDAGGDWRSGTIEVIELNLKLLLGEE